MRRIILAAVIVILLAPAQALAADDTTPPLGSISVVNDDRAAELVRLDVTATDDLSGVATVEVSANGTTWASYANAPQVAW